MRKRAALVLLLAGCAPSHHHTVQVKTAGIPIQGPAHEPITTTTEEPTTTTTSEAPSPAPTAAPKPLYATQSTEAPHQVYAAPESTYAPVKSGEIAVSSTEYCDRGATASGGRGQDGTAAMNGVPLGSQWEVEETGRIYTINDRIGSGSDFDIWTSSCSAALNYGRHYVHVRRVA